MVDGLKTRGKGHVFFWFSQKHVFVEGLDKATFHLLANFVGGE